MLTQSQKVILDYLNRMQLQSIHGLARWFTPSDVHANVYVQIPRINCGGCARLLQSLVDIDLVEVRTATTVGRWPRMEYRVAVMVGPRTCAKASVGPKGS